MPLLNDRIIWGDWGDWTSTGKVGVFQTYQSIANIGYMYYMYRWPLGHKQKPSLCSPNIYNEDSQHVSTLLFSPPIHQIAAVDNLKMVFCDIKSHNILKNKVTEKIYKYSCWKTESFTRFWFVLKKKKWKTWKFLINAMCSIFYYSFHP